VDVPSGELKGAIPAAGAGLVPEPAAGKTPSLLPLSVTSLIDTLKLPPGRWSASILSFAKFFSLPLEGNVFNQIRQQVLEILDRSANPVPGGSGEQTENTAEFREALTLAALAARSKGVELSPEALVEYARALFRGREGDSAEGDSAMDGEADSTAGDRNPGEKPEGGNGVSGGTDAGTGDRPGENGGNDAAEKDRGAALRERILGAGGPLLDLLNKLPGKGGKRWIILPFSADGSLECCLRILLVPRAGSAVYRAERLGLDIRHREKAEPAWSFILRLDTAEPAGAQSPLLEVFCYPAQARTEALEQELAEILGFPPESVRVRGGQFPVFAEDSRDWTLFSVNKEV
jgi:hypothetical protein